MDAKQRAVIRAAKAVGVKRQPSPADDVMWELSATIIKLAEKITLAKDETEISRVIDSVKQIRANAKQVDDEFMSAFITNNLISVQVMLGDAWEIARNGGGVSASAYLRGAVSKLNRLSREIKTAMVR